MEPGEKWELENGDIVTVKETYVDGGDKVKTKEQGDVDFEDFDEKVE